MGPNESIKMAANESSKRWNVVAMGEANRRHWRIPGGLTTMLSSIVLIMLGHDVVEVYSWTLPGLQRRPIGSATMSTAETAVNSRPPLTVVTATRQQGHQEDAVSTTSAATNNSTVPQSYNLGLGKNKPKVPGDMDTHVSSSLESNESTSAAQNWVVPQSVVKPPVVQPPESIRGLASSVATMKSANITAEVRTRRMVA